MRIHDPRQVRGLVGVDVHQRQAVRRRTVADRHRVEGLVFVTHAAGAQHMRGAGDAGGADRPRRAPRALAHAALGVQVTDQGDAGLQVRVAEAAPRRRHLARHLAGAHLVFEQRQVGAADQRPLHRLPQRLR